MAMNGPDDKRNAALLAEIAKAYETMEPIQVLVALGMVVQDVSRQVFATWTQAPQTEVSDGQEGSSSQSPVGLGGCPER